MDNKVERKPKIAILQWEEGGASRGLDQLEGLIGNSTNIRSYSFPVRLKRVEGANLHSVIIEPSDQLLNKMIKDVKTLTEEEGIQAVVTSCGFNAIFQEKLADALDISVYTSSLILLPTIERSLGKNKKILVITANKEHLSKEHFERCGAFDHKRYVVLGLEKNKEWNTIFSDPDNDIDIEVVKKDILSETKNVLEKHPEIGAILLECTDLPPFSKAIRKMSHLPVFDFISMINLAAYSLGEVEWI